MEPKYKRVLLKLSGEALEEKKKSGIDFDTVTKYCEPVNGRVSILELYDMFRKDPTLEAIANLLMSDEDLELYKQNLSCDL